MLTQDVTATRASGSVFANLGTSTERMQSLGSLFDSTGGEDRFLSSLSGNSAFSGLYTDQGTLETLIAPAQATTSPLTPTISATVRSAMSAYQSLESGGSSTGGPFSAPLTTAIETGVADTSLFGLSYVSAGNVLNLLA